LSACGDRALWYIMASCVAIFYTSPCPYVPTLLLRAYGRSVASQPSSMEGGAAFISTPATPVLTRVLPKATPPRCASRRTRSMPPRRRSPCACTRLRPRRRVRCAPPQRSVSIVTTNARWLICPGRRLACTSSCACASGFAAIAPITASRAARGVVPLPLLAALADVWWRFSLTREGGAGSWPHGDGIDQRRQLRHVHGELTLQAYQVGIAQAPSTIVLVGIHPNLARQDLAVRG
jgi:hypothetical protein